MDPLFFLHIPKTAGTSLRLYLTDQFETGTVCPDIGWGSMSLARAKRLCDYKLIQGHFDTRILPFLPPRCRKATFLREPVARTISAINHALLDPAFRPPSLEVEGRTLRDIVHDPTSMRLFGNSQTGLLSADGTLKNSLASYHTATGDERLPLLDDITPNLTIALEMIKEFDFVGLTECFADGLLQLADKCGLYPVVLPPALNIGRRFDNALTTEDIEIVKSCNDLDLHLYEVAKAINKTYAGRPLSRDPVLRNYFKEKPAAIPNGAAFDLRPPFAGWGFYECEVVADGKPFRWSGPHRTSGITLKVEPGHDYQFTIRYWLKGGPHANNVTFTLNEHIITGAPTTTYGLSSVQCATRVDASTGGFVDIRARTDQVGSAGEDLRLIGFLLSEVLVERLR